MSINDYDHDFHAANYCGAGLRGMLSMFSSAQDFNDAWRTDAITDMDGVDAQLQERRLVADGVHQHHVCFTEPTNSNNLWARGRRSRSLRSGTGHTGHCQARFRKPRRSTSP